jgi:hypothetical protein
MWKCDRGRETVWRKRGSDKSCNVVRYCTGGREEVRWCDEGREVVRSCRDKKRRIV